MPEEKEIIHQEVEIEHEGLIEQLEERLETPLLILGFHLAFINRSGTARVSSFRVFRVFQAARAEDVRALQHEISALREEIRNLSEKFSMRDV